MPTWSTRSVLLSAACAPVLGASAIFASAAHAQVTAANTIAPANTVVVQPLPTIKPSSAIASALSPAAAPTIAPTIAPATVKSAAKARKVRSTAGIGVATTTTLSAKSPTGIPPTDTVPADDSVVAPPVEAVSFSDPLADLAAAALLVIPAGTASGGVPANGQTAALPAVAAAPATAVIQFAATPAPGVTPASADPNTPRPPSSTGSSSVIINTADLAEYVVGTVIVAPVSQESQAVLSALPTVGSDRYAALLTALAKVVGQRTKTDPSALEAVWLRTEPRRMKAILTAMAQVGTRYHYSGNQPGGFDCSGLTSYAWSQAGVKIPRTSTLQYQGLARKSPADLLPGDIVWHPGHVSMSIGVDQAVIDAPQTGKTVEVKKSPAKSWVTLLSPL